MAVAFLPVFYGKLALNDVPTLVGVEVVLWASAAILRGGGLPRDYAISRARRSGSRRHDQVHRAAIVDPAVGLAAIAC